MKTSVNYKLVRELYDAGLLDIQIAAKAPCSTRTVLEWRRKTGRPKNKPSLWKHLDIHGKPLWEDGLFDTQIAAHIGCSTSTVFDWREDRGLPANYTGDKESQAMLDLPCYRRRERIAFLHGEGLTDREMAAALEEDKPENVGRTRNRMGLVANKGRRVVVERDRNGESEVRR